VSRTTIGAVRVTRKMHDREEDKLIPQLEDYWDVDPVEHNPKHHQSMSSILL
jgi:hypothetical protein